MTEVDEALAESHRTRLRALVNDQAPGLEARLEIRTGTRFEEVIRFVLRNDVDLVLKTAEALRGIHRYLFASTDQHLLRKCPCPTWLRFPGSGGRLRTVVAAVDVEASASSEPDTLAGLNRRILDTAVGLAGADGAVVHVIHVWDAVGEGLIRSWSQAPDPLRVARTYVDEVQVAHREALEALIRETRAGLPDGVAERVRLVPRIRRGETRSAIPEDVRTLGADVLVMGTVARIGVPGFIIGNTAEDILNSLECSVVTVKPPGYASPMAAALL